jgi:putative ABC transport system permease protein
MYLGLWVSQPFILAQYGLYVPITPPGLYEWALLGAILAASILMGSVPAWRAYRQSLVDGLSIRT